MSTCRIMKCWCTDINVPRHNPMAGMKCWCTDINVPRHNQMAGMKCWCTDINVPRHNPMAGTMFDNTSITHHYSDVVDITRWLEQCLTIQQVLLITTAMSLTFHKHHNITLLM